MQNGDKSGPIAHDANKDQEEKKGEKRKREKKNLSGQQHRILTSHLITSNH